MFLETDEQTIRDLGIFGRQDAGGIYDLYNQTHTRGGEALLQEMFRAPLAERGAIRTRAGIIRDFARLGAAFPFDATALDMAEKYLAQGKPSAAPSEREIADGVAAVITLIQDLSRFMQVEGVAGIGDYAAERGAIQSLLSTPALAPARQEQTKGKRSYTAINAYDLLFRVRERATVEGLLAHIYRLDVFISVARVATDRRFVFPEVLEAGPATLRLEGVYHPSLKNPVANTLFMQPGEQVVFLTGANMAGKSTFLRSVSTALYLAHMGFPVAAGSMTFSLLDGLYTTVNLPDNLGIGASHFYAEVLRLKKIATELSRGKALFVLFDELFRGTNVKDAHEATVAVTAAFAGKKDSLFIISSHIVEAGEDLRARGNIGFLYLPTRMNGHVPEYTYTLERGITDDRHGMIIIRNEGILDTLKKHKP
ncbi:MAG TPA: hypothetical protein VL547_02180 [Dinghuibacter sp.]|uniref:MutS-related protein n=1 Tax=Dinghuibacter sp. TaxID=2024697 RepID=UPI002B9F23F9|nr:DNA mismatch repair protein [Dinghuibacter sp.]HTJ10799.1 hypothetical protein [Dinghuibacter sp.]